MKNSLSNLPEVKQRELALITDLLKKSRGVHMVLLFGSYARGNYVEDRYVEDGTFYEYISDFDILVITAYEDAKNNFGIEKKIEKKLGGRIKTRVSLIFHSIKQINEMLEIGNYFFQEIKREGIVLFDTKKYSLKNPKRLTRKEAQEKARDYFDYWFESAFGFFSAFQFGMERSDYLNAAFQLHQATERYYTTILLVYTDYRPKEHDLFKLEEQVCRCDTRFDIFPRSTEEEKNRFELLRRAYIDARYKMKEYFITKEDLWYLASRVEILKERTALICKEHIENGISA